MSGRPPDPRGVRVSLLGGETDSPLVVDGPPVAGLTVVDEERAILRTDDGSEVSRVLLLPPTPAPGRHGLSRREVVVDGWRFEVEIEPAGRAALRERASRGREDAAHSGPLEVHAIIPGVVVALSVAAGDAVVAGQQLLVIEAMKMQNELRAPRDGTVERVAVGPGVTIEVGDLLVVLS